MFWVPSDIFPDVGSLGQKVLPLLIFWCISILLPTVAAPVCIPTQCNRVPFFTSSKALVCWFIDDGHSDRCEMVSCGFYLHFSDDSWCWEYLSVGHLLKLWYPLASVVLRLLYLVVTRWLCCIQKVCSHKRSSKSILHLVAKLILNYFS